VRWLLVVLALCATANAEPPQLKLTHEPPPRSLKMRPHRRTAAAATNTDATAAPTAAPEGPAATVAASASPPDPGDAGSVRDLRRPISVRFNFGYVVDGTALTGDPNLNQHVVQGYEFAQLRAYALGEGYASSRGVLWPSLSTYFAGRFQLMRRTVSADPNDMMGHDVQVAPPIANWFDRSVFATRSGWAEVQDFLPYKRLAPLRLRGGNLYTYGPWPLHMWGIVAAWEGKLIRGSIYNGFRASDYAQSAAVDKNNALIAGSSLRLDLRNLTTPVPFAISGEFLTFTDVAAGDNAGSNHSLIQLDWRPRKDVALIGRVRTINGELANEHLQLRSRYKQVTNFVFDAIHRRTTDWRWDPSVPQTDPLVAKRYLDLGPVVPQLLVSGRAGTLIKENIDLLLRVAYANDLVTTDLERSTFAASYLEVGGGIEGRLRRTVGVGLNGLSRQTKRHGTVATQIPDIPNEADPLPFKAASSLGEEGFTELGTTVRLSLGARRFSAIVEIYGRRTRYAPVYCAALQAGVVDPNCMSDLDTGIPTSDLRGGGRATIDAWIGNGLRLFASYELSSRLDLQREIYGFKSLRMMVEGVY